MKVIKVNGKFAAYTPMTLLEFLQQHEYNPAHVVVERNMEIITKERFAEVELNENDEINILKFLGGG